MQSSYTQARFTFMGHGEYNNLGENKTIEITHGSSRDGRPEDLKQFAMELICTGDGDLPIWMKMCSGNSSDQKQFGGAMVKFKKLFNGSLLFIPKKIYK